MKTNPINVPPDDTEADPQSQNAREFHQRRDAAQRWYKRSRWAVFVFLLGAASSQLQVPPWLPFAISGGALLLFFVLVWRAATTFRCPACSRIALEKEWWQDDANRFPTDPFSCPHCHEALK